jgi:hypothetical protein
MKAGQRIDRDDSVGVEGDRRHVFDDTARMRVIPEGYQPVTLCRLDSMLNWKQIWWSVQAGGTGMTRNLGSPDASPVASWPNTWLEKNETGRADPLATWLKGWLKENKADNRDLDLLVFSLLIIAVFIGFEIGGRAGGIVGWIAGALVYVVSMWFIIRWNSRR